MLMLMGRGHRLRVHQSGRLHCHQSSQMVQQRLRRLKLKRTRIRRLKQRAERHRVRQPGQSLDQNNRGARRPGMEPERRLAEEPGRRGRS